MHTLIFDRHNINLEYENNCIIIRQPEQPPRTLPLTQIQTIICLHSVVLTTSLLGQLWQRGIDFITLNSRYSERSFALHPNQQRQVERRCRQYQWQQHEHQCLPLARQLCQHRLQTNIRLHPDIPDLTQRLHTLKNRMSNSHSLSELRGVEGTAQRLIFEHWRQQLPPSLGFCERNRRPPADPVNALLSLTYTLAQQEAIRQCTAAGLDPQLGFYHRTAYGRHSLACDLMESVRPYCEQWVFRQFIQGHFNRTHFTQPSAANPACLLGKRGRERYYQAIAEQRPHWRQHLQASARWLTRQLHQTPPQPEQQP
jgi:CRISP-associated protein Cas1